MSRVLKPCGTKAAYMRHLRRGEPVDDACEQANKDYSKTYAANGRNKARQRALLALAKRHRSEFDALYIGELNRVREEAGR